MRGKEEEYLSLRSAVQSVQRVQGHHCLRDGRGSRHSNPRSRRSQRNILLSRQHTSCTILPTCESWPRRVPRHLQCRSSSLPRRPEDRLALLSLRAGHLVTRTSAGAGRGSWVDGRRRGDRPSERVDSH